MGIIHNITALGLLAMGAFAPAQAATVTYTTFRGADLSLEAWEGAHVTVLTQSAARDPGVMSQVVGQLDAAWGLYRDLTGQAPVAWAPYTLNGRATIAEVADTCGAGCAFLGLNGIEIMPTYMDLLYDGVRDAGQFDQVLFYELGRNFWFYGGKLGAAPPMATGFAVANRFVSMEETGAQGAPFNGTEPFDAFKQFVTVDQMAAYQADESLNWESAIGAGLGIPGRRYGDGASLAGAMLYQIYADHGYDAYRDFYTNLTLLPDARDPAQAAHNLMRAAYVATGQNYATAFKAQAYAAAVPLPGALGGVVLAVASLIGVSVRRRSRGRA